MTKIRLSDLSDEVLKRKAEKYGIPTTVYNSDTGKRGGGIDKPRHVLIREIKNVKHGINNKVSGRGEIKSIKLYGYSDDDEMLNSLGINNHYESHDNSYHDNSYHEENHHDNSLHDNHENYSSSNELVEDRGAKSSYQARWPSKFGFLIFGNRVIKIGKGDEHTPTEKALIVEKGFKWAP